MGDYLEVDIILDPPEPGREILIAHLAEFPFESFQETEGGLKAYIPATDWKEEYRTFLEHMTLPDTRLSFILSTIKSQNWNAVWEAGFEPIRVDARCRIRAPFHPKTDALYEIEIMPKMSFGTGHHETTCLMLRLLLDLDVEGKKVLDMGCGTGVLAILACKMNASEIYAIDIDPWGYENTLENCRRNACDSIRVELGDATRITGELHYDVILANINKNVLLGDIPVYANALDPDGILLLSGFYKEDLHDIDAMCGQVGLARAKFQEKNNWVAAKYVF